MQQLPNWRRLGEHGVDAGLVSRLLVACTLCLAFGLGMPAAGQNTPATASSTNGESELTAKLIQQRLEELDKLTDLDESTRQKIADMYKQALTALETAGKNRAEAERLKREASQMPQRIEELKAGLSRPRPQVGVAAPAKATLPELEQRLADAEAALKAAQAKLDAAEKALQEAPQTRAQTTELLAKSRAQAEEIEKSLTAAPAPGEPKALTLANRTLLMARQRELEAQVELLEAQLAYNDAAREWLPLNRDMASRELLDAQERVAAWRQIVDTRRQEELHRQTTEARRAAARAHPALKSVAEENQRLAEFRSSAEAPAAKRRRIEDELKRLGDLLQDLKTRRLQVEEKLKIPGMESVIGPQLLAEREQLPSVGRLRRSILARQQRISEAQLKLLELRQQRRALVPLDPQVERILAGIEPPPDEFEREDLKAEAADLLNKQRELLDGLIADYTAYIDALYDLSAREQELIAAAESFAALLDEHILWIRSTVPVWETAWSDVVEAARWIGSPARWWEVPVSFWQATLDEPVTTILPLLLIVLLFATSSMLRRRLQELGDLASQSYTQPFHLTLQAVALTLLIAAQWPLLVGVVGWRLENFAFSTEFAHAVGHGLFIVALSWFALDGFRQVCRSDGLGAEHFHWSIERLKRNRRHLRWLAAGGLPCVFLVATTQAYGVATYRDTWGRWALMTGLMLLALFIARVTRPTAAAPAAGVATRSGFWMRLGRALAIAAPLLLALLAVAGYYYTAFELSWRLLATVALVLVLIMLHAMVTRWLYGMRARAALEVSRLKQEAERAAEEAPETRAAAPSETAPPPVPAIDLAAVNQQTRRLLQWLVVVIFLAGAWGVWHDVLPALTLLDRPLWSTTVEVTRTVTGPDGSEVPQTFPEARVITVGRLLLAILIALVTLQAAKNIPGLLEVALLNQLPLDPAARYAIVAIIKYAITGVGLVIALGTIGIGWSNIQWLAAALTFGLAFGLQEIFANFVSGLILLFEQPIRVGDIVTVENVTGVVTRIRIRATTIRDWDRKEFVVPNKELITGRLLNWTLSDTMNRIVIKVGVSYDSDTNRVRELLKQILADHPQILDDPAPLVTFEEFGDSTLNFVIRAYLEKFDTRMETIHELHAEIHRRLTDEGIEIAFPQQDLHIRSIDATLPVQTRPSEPTDVERST